MESISITYFAVCSLITFLFAFLGGLFLVTIPKRSPAAFHMGMSFLGTGSMGLAYLFTSTWYGEAGAYHRWLTVVGVYVGLAHITQFFLAYPEDRFPRISRIILIAQYIAGIALSVLFIVKTGLSPKGYRFEGHFYDFFADEISTFIGLTIQLFTLVFIVVGIWQIIAKPGSRAALAGILLGYIVVTVLPGITNTLSRDGGLDRGVHQTVWCVLVVLGAFVVIVVFVNTTKDRTTFMAKIVGTSLVTILLVLQVASLFVFNELEHRFDDVHRMAAARVLRDPAFQTDDLRYVTSFDAARGVRQFTRNPESDMDWAEAELDQRNTVLLEKIRRGSGEDGAKSLEALLAAAHPDFDGHAAYLRARSLSPGGLDSALLLADLDARSRALIHRRTKLGRVLPEKFQAEIEKQTAKPGPELLAYDQILRDLTTKGMDGSSLKEKSLRILTPAHKVGHRFFRTDRTGHTHYVAYLEVDGNTVHEVGFDYRGYRKYVHQTGLIFTALIGFSVVIVVFGFRFFFLGNLVNPLEALLAGVRKVNEGDLDVAVPVTVQDEIGYISRSFNRMVKSIKGAKLRLQKYADGLEEKVKERTRELSETLEEVQNLKSQQDGDYFLTSLLLRPLGSVETGSETVSVETLVKQKKRFEFRKWKEEIGGDLCIARRINLREREYTVFLNADAMGKSMQGAGGALVLGAVFQTVIERTLGREEAQNDYPERWIKGAFLELQKVFESFDGSMLVSLVLGVLDEVTGLLYYINAEHPWMVLYRAGEASFVEKELLFRKVGTQGLGGGIYVQTFQMEPGDVILAGSDGRDDLMLGTTAGGDRIINEDETLFLRVVERTAAELNRITDELLREGELTDDLSLIRIGYREEHPHEVEAPVSGRMADLLREAKGFRSQGDIEALIRVLEEAYGLDNARPDVIRELAKAYFKKGDFVRAASFSEDYVFLRPGATDFLFAASLSNRRAGEWKKALELGERVRLRDPRMVRNLLNLAEIYIQQANFSRAGAMLDHAAEIEPGDRHVASLRQKLETERSAR